MILVISSRPGKPSFHTSIYVGLHPPWALDYPRASVQPINLWFFMLSNNPLALTPQCLLIS